jgi:hypothetical protein
VTVLQLERFYPPSVAIALLEPIKKLREAVYLIIVPSLGELQQLSAEVLEPLGTARQMHVCIETMDRSNLSMPATLRRPIPKLYAFLRVRSFSRHRSAGVLRRARAEGSEQGWQRLRGEGLEEVFPCQILGAVSSI